MENIYDKIIAIVYKRLIGFPRINFFKKKIEIEPTFYKKEGHQIYYNHSTTVFLDYLTKYYIKYKAIKDDYNNIIKIIVLTSPEEFLCLLKVQGAL